MTPAAPRASAISGLGQRAWAIFAIRFAGISVFISAAFAVMPVVQAQHTAPTEYQVEAAYLYNFGKFVTWPDKGTMNDREPFEICVLGDDPFGGKLEQVAAARDCYLRFLDLVPEGRVANGVRAQLDILKSMLN